MLQLPFFGNKIDVMFYRLEDETNFLDLGLVDFLEGYAEPFTDLTVRVPGSLFCAPDEAYVKTWGENEGIGEWLEETGLAKPTGEFSFSGFVKIPKYKFDLELIEQFMYRSHFDFVNEWIDDGMKERKENYA